MRESGWIAWLVICTLWCILAAYLWRKDFKCSAEPAPDTLAKQMKDAGFRDGDPVSFDGVAGAFTTKDGKVKRLR